MLYQLFSLFQHQINVLSIFFHWFPRSCYEIYLTFIVYLSIQIFYHHPYQMLLRMLLSFRPAQQDISHNFLHYGFKILGGIELRFIFFCQLPNKFFSSTCEKLQSVFFTTKSLIKLHKNRQIFVHSSHTVHNLYKNIRKISVDHMHDCQCC